jgi:hypothetical protein
MRLCCFKFAVQCTVEWGLHFLFVALPFEPILSSALNVISFTKAAGLGTVRIATSACNTGFVFSVTSDGAVGTSNEEVVCWGGFQY